jgi:hypothetical protein
MMGQLRGPAVQGDLGSDQKLPKSELQSLLITFNEGTYKVHIQWMGETGVTERC